MPSAPTTKDARTVPPPSMVAVTPSASWSRRASSWPRWIVPPSSPRRLVSTCSVMSWGSISVYGWRPGSPSKSIVRRARSRSRTVKRGTMTPRRTSSSLTPMPPRNSSVRAWITAAREVLAPPAALSTRTTSTPRACSAVASVRPTGPAPTMRTSVLLGSSDMSGSLVNGCLPTLVDFKVPNVSRLVNKRWPTLVGMGFSRRSEETRAAILAAARRRFAADGFEGTTIRAIAAEAGIDPSMVMRYYGSKDRLFAAAADLDLQLPDLAAVPREKLGETLVRHWVARWEGNRSDELLTVLLRSAVTNEAAAEQLRVVFGAQVARAVAAVVDDRAEAPVRAGLVATQMLGLALCRHILRLPPVVALDAETLVAGIAVTVQRYLTGPLAGTP